MEKDNLVNQPSSPLSAAPQIGKDSDLDFFDFDALGALTDEDVLAIIKGQDMILYGSVDNQAMAPGGNQSVDMEVGIEPGLISNANQKF